MHNPNPIREKMAELDETQWRIEPLGWDSEDREYLVLDDDRLYRRTEPPLPPEPKPKPKPKKTRNTRSNKRRRVSRKVVEDTPDEEEENAEVNGADKEHKEEDPYGGWSWELIAVTLEDYNEFIDKYRRSKDPNEKALCQRLKGNVIPVLLEKAEERQRESARRARELENMQKLATAKRSSRLADKAQKEKERSAVEEAERKHREEIEMAHMESERQRKMEQDRHSRMMTREQRIKEREVKRILHEEQLAREQEQLAKLEEQGKIEESERQRISERKLKAEVKRRKEELESLQQVDDDWVFDCAVCGMYGQNYDDGTHSVACEKCSVWQHSACHGITQEQAECEDFHFVCRDCKQRAENPIPPMRIKFGTASKAEESNKGTKRSANGHIALQTARRPDSTTNGAGMSSTSHGTAQPVSQGSSAIPLAYPGPPPTPPSSSTPRAPATNGSFLPSLPIHRSPQPPLSGNLSSLGHSRGNASMHASRPANVPGYAVYNWSNDTSVNRTSLPSHTNDSQTHPATSNGFYHQQYVQPTTQPPHLQYPAFPRSYQQSAQPAASQINTPQKSNPTAASPSTNSARLGYSPISTASPKTSFPPPTASPANLRPTSAGKGSTIPTGTPLTQLNHNDQSRSVLPPGSSPGYSPEKHSPAATPAQHLTTSPSAHAHRPTSSHNHTGSRDPTIPPIILSPTHGPQVLSPPVKHATPERLPPLEQRTNMPWSPAAGRAVASVGEATPAAMETPCVPDHPALQRQLIEMQAQAPQHAEQRRQ